MKIVSFRSPFLSMALAFASTGQAAEYMPADRQVECLETVVSLSPAQEKAALEIFQNLKDIIDSIPLSERAVKGAQSRQDARAAIQASIGAEKRLKASLRKMTIGSEGFRKPFLFHDDE